MYYITHPVQDPFSTRWLAFLKVNIGNNCIFYLTVLNFILDHSAQNPLPTQMLKNSFPEAVSAVRSFC